MLFAPQPNTEVIVTAISPLNNPIRKTSDTKVRLISFLLAPIAFSTPISFFRSIMKYSLRFKMMGWK